jgi:uncharacterized protein
MSLEQKLQDVQKHIALGVRRPEAPTQHPAPSHYDWSTDFVGEFAKLGDSRSFSRTTRYAANHIHGLHALADLRTVTGGALSVISRDPELAYADLANAVFLDTETTGLGMGTGTYVFLVGIGYLDHEGFAVTQFFLDGPGDERTFLDELQRFLARFPVIVTFNGKAFDLPLLDTRYRLHRRPGPFTDPPHVDLLHPARRIWKRRLASCALSSLETEILGVSRTVEDVAGWEIPLRYFRYQRSRDGSTLEGVFYHNLMDILSLATLTVHIDRIVADPMCGLIGHPTDFFGIGKTYELAGDGEMAVYCYDESLRRGLESEIRQDCLLRLGAIHKRERRWDAALQVWEVLLDDGGRSALVARVELAKYHEHVERDYVAAIEHVQQALSLAEIYESPWPAASLRDLEHRLSRLLNRSIRARSWSGSYS